MDVACRLSVISGPDTERDPSIRVSVHCPSVTPHKLDRFSETRGQRLDPPERACCSWKVVSLLFVSETSRPPSLSSFVIRVCVPF
ncbi:hypothetical protein BaRGS_00023538 [Batillaria attramentaria]|uniref:Uncharacterized protein n=1 Tax=Batillaria attramentaria TaxID=370345 RepID=A0ABD0KEC9_9CAEN